MIKIFSTDLKIKNRFVLFIICLFLTVCICSSLIFFNDLQAFATEENSGYVGQGVVDIDKASDDLEPGTTVRVGYFIDEGYQEGAEGEYKTGSGYEYLQRISNLNNWNYDYIYGTYSELYDMLTKGQIDILGNVAYTSDRDEEINFSYYPQGKEQYYLTCLADRFDLRTGNVEVLNGCKIGVNADSFQSELLEEWILNNKLDVEVISLDGSEELFAALDSQNIDALVMNGVTGSSNYSSIISIGYSEYYFGVAKNRPDLLEALNRALYFIQSTDPIFNDKVYSKYASNTNGDLMLTESEHTWLDKHPIVTIGYVDDYLPFSGTDSSGHATGIMTLVVNRIVNILSIQNELIISFKKYSSSTMLMEGLHSGDIDAAFPMMSDLYGAEQAGIMETYEVFSSSVALIYSGDYNKEIKTIAASGHSPMQNSFATLYYPECEIVETDSADECLTAVLEGKADGTLFNVARAQYFFSLPQYSRLHMAQIPGSVSYCFILKNGNTELLSIFNRGITALDEAYVVEHLNDYITYDTSYTIRNFMQEHLLLCFCLLFIIIALLTGIVALFMVKRRSDIFAVTDQLTGCFNRSALNRIAEAKGNNNSIAVIMCDLNSLKEKNDKGGHEAGDKYICDAANLLTDVFGKKNVFRIGGDEFAVVCQSIEFEKAESLIAEFKVKAEAVGVSTALGYEYRNAYDVPFDEILKAADAKMYAAKAEYYAMTGKDRRGARR